MTPAPRRPRWAASTILVALAAISSTGLHAQVGLDATLAASVHLGWSGGAEDAAALVVEFTDISCPYCADFHAGSRAELRREFVESGQVRWVTMSYISGLYPHSGRLAVAAECAGRQGRYEAFTGAAYRVRDAWVSASREVAEAEVRRLASEVAVAGPDFDRCRTDPAVDERLERIGALAREVGVRGTPTWFVEGFPVMGSLPLGYARQFILTRLPGGDVQASEGAARELPSTLW